MTEQALRDALREIADKAARSATAHYKYLGDWQANMKVIQRRAERALAEAETPERLTDLVRDGVPASAIETALASGAGPLAVAWASGDEPAPAPEAPAAQGGAVL